MTYLVQGLRREPFEDLIGASKEALARAGAQRVRASGPGFPCRVSLEEAGEGESLILLNFVSHDVAGPFRTAYAIYVRETAADAPVYLDTVPPLLDKRTLGLRGFDRDGMLCGAMLALPGEADGRIRELLHDPRIAAIHAHNAAAGCFLAKVERD
jgi:hypothetical protein